MNADELLKSIRKKVIFRDYSPLTSVFSIILYKAKIEITDEKAEGFYAYTDGEKIFIPKEVISKFDIEQLTGIVLHELLHLCREDFLRREELNEQDYMLWNYVSDAFINGWLEESYIKLPQGIITREKVRQLVPEADFKNMTTEQIYYLLKKKGIKPEKVFVHKSTQKRNGKVNWRREFNSVSSLFGKESGILSEMTKEIKREEPLDINIVLSKYFREIIPEDYSHIYYDKVLWVNEDLYLPSLIGFEKPKIAFFIDVSGSIPTNLVEKFVDIAFSTLQKYHIDSSDFIYFDTEIVKIEENKKNFETYVYTGGGTSLVKVFKFIEEKEYDLVVILTDGYAEYPKEISYETKQKTIFVIPFGGNVDEAKKYGSVAIIK